MKLLSVVAIAASLSAFTGSAKASMITTMDPSNFQFNCLSGFGGGCGQTFGQSFTVGADSKLTDFTFKFSPVTNGSLLNVVFQLYEWSGTQRIGQVLYQSGVTAITNATNLYSWAANTELTTGHQYMAIVNAANLGNGQQTSGLFSSGSNPYTGGALAYERVAGNNGWEYAPGYDFAFTANFVSPVPEPSTWAMMMLGFAGLGYMTYRKRKTPSKAIAT